MIYRGLMVGSNPPPLTPPPPPLLLNSHSKNDLKRPLPNRKKCLDPHMQVISKVLNEIHLECTIMTRAMYYDSCHDLVTI